MTYIGAPINAHALKGGPCVPFVSSNMQSMAAHKRAAKTRRAA